MYKAKPIKIRKENKSSDIISLIWFMYFIKEPGGSKLV